ncbi:hypothetical protein CROQUDRAFT_87014 [Cronartium quercuum f. sp. fusiforme G11]|uniref:alpha-1,2-Mannosidase n=1 Tax=Cronartium quercuum f. sp. fusiforme G11 TaxID=708437 RepID=A0A9P6NVR9_9BASI|nr:hypothetical protein CROQUDRAFT_87014 [Cronartium quercuum f. sp. fusiforme G11]
MRSIYPLHTQLSLSTRVTCNISGQIQKPGLEQSPKSKQRAEFVKKEFLSAYRDYMKYGFPSDEILPVTKKGQNTRNGWSATLVDSLDTLFLMGFKDEFNDAVQKTLKINFKRSQTWDTVSIMETTIRYLGGILSAYELTGANNKGLLDQARQIGETLSAAWKSDKQQLPYSRFYTTFNYPSSDEVSLAAAGSLIIEFDRLSHYTGNPKYRLLAERAERFLMTTPGMLPGMPALVYNVKDNSVIEDWTTWGCADSYYEYLLKYAMLTHNVDPIYSKSWTTAVDTSIEHLIATSTYHNLTYLADFSESQGLKDLTFSHLACFAGGNWMMGGQWLHNQQYLQYGLEIVDTCMKSYTTTKTGLGPDVFRFDDPASQPNADPKSSAQNEQSLKKRGFYITEPKYILRPEVFESVFYAWRITGDEKYQEFTWHAFGALQKYCKASASYSAIDDVDSAKPQLTNNCESFLYVDLSLVIQKSLLGELTPSIFCCLNTICCGGVDRYSETFKYIYLTFAPPELISLDDFIFNTEAHPFRYTASKSTSKQENLIMNVRQDPEPESPQKGEAHTDF